MPGSITVFIFSVCACAVEIAATSSSVAMRSILPSLCWRPPYPTLPYPNLPAPQLGHVVPRGVEVLPVSDAGAWAAVVVGGDAHGVAAIANPHGEREVVASWGADDADELPLGCGGS